MELARGEQANGTPRSGPRSERRPEPEISPQTRRPNEYLLVIRSRSLVRPQDTSAYRSQPRKNGRCFSGARFRQSTDLSSRLPRDRDLSFFGSREGVGAPCPTTRVLGFENSEERGRDRDRENFEEFVKIGHCWILGHLVHCPRNIHGFHTAFPQRRDFSPGYL